MAAFLGAIKRLSSELLPTSPLPPKEALPLLNSIWEQYGVPRSMVWAYHARLLDYRRRYLCELQIRLMTPTKTQRMDHFHIWNQVCPAPSAFFFPFCFFAFFLSRCFSAVIPLLINNW